MLALRRIKPSGVMRGSLLSLRVRSHSIDANGLAAK